MLQVFVRLHIAALLLHFAKRWNEPEVIAILGSLFIASLFNFRELLTFFLANAFIIVVHAPIFPRLANHSNIALFVALFVVGHALVTLVRGSRVDEDLIKNGLRGMAIVLYFYVGFHKLNDGFLHPIESCAYWFHDRIENTFLDGAFTIPELIREISPWAVIFVELFAAALLLFPATWMFGLGLALPVHLYVSLSGFTDFSSLMHATMILFLPSRFWTLLDQNQRFRNLFVRSLILYILIVLLYTGLTGLMTWSWSIDRHSIVDFHGLIYNIAVAELTMAVLFILMVGRIGLMPDNWAIAWPSWKVRHCVFPAIIFIWGAFPYLFGSQTSLTMFSNLVTESERQNHLLLDTDLTKIYDFERDLVYIKDIYSQNRLPARYDLQGYFLPESEFRFMASSLVGAPVSLVVEYRGEIVNIPDLASSSFAKEDLTSAFLTFRQIDPFGPAKCRW